MENNKYIEGKNICDEIFWKTGDIRFYNMSKGFEKLESDNKTA